jgi:pentatricopeptide repeat protein
MKSPECSKQCTAKPCPGVSTHKNKLNKDQQTTTVEAKQSHLQGTYSLLLGMFGKAGLYREAAEMFWKMHDKGFLPGVPTYNALIDAYGRGGLLEEAEHVYEDMLEAKKAPSLGTFAALGAAIAASGDAESARDLHSDMQEGGYRADGPAFCSLISTYAKVRDSDSVAGLLREMSAPRQSLEVSTLAGLLVGRYDDDYRCMSRFGRVLFLLFLICKELNLVEQSSGNRPLWRLLVESLGSRISLHLTHASLRA